jgi:Na+-driven multidrug efflux pump
MGVAVASVIARTVQLLLFLGYLTHRRHPLRLINLYRTRQLMHPYVKSYRASALPLTVNFTLWGFGTFVYHGIASHVGTDALASLSLVSPIEGMYHALFFGFVTACSVLIGQNLGRNNFDEAMLLAKRFTLFAPLASVFVGLLLFLLKPVYLPLLLNPGDSLYQLSEQLLFVVCFTSWIKTLNMVLIIGILRAGGDNKYVLGTDMIAMWLLGIPASFVAAFVFELSYVWVYAMVLIEEIAKATLAFRRARKRIWLRNLTLDDDFSPESEAA